MVGPVESSPNVYDLHSIGADQTNPTKAPSFLSPPGSLTILTFCTLIMKAADDFQQEQEEFDIFNELLSRGFFLSVIGNAAGLVARREGLDEHLAEWANLLSTQDGQVDAQNTQINNYNAGVSDEQMHTHNLNQAIIAYNNDPSPANEAALTAAISAYEAYRSTRNPQITNYNATVSAYNSNVATNNNTINTLNLERPDLGLSDIPAQNTIPTRALMPPAPSGPPYVSPTPLPPRLPEDTIPDVPEPPPVASINSDITNLNNSIDAHNTGILDEIEAIETLNAAIAQYNAGQISAAQLQTAVNNYNAFKAGRDPQITAFNNGSLTPYNNSVPGHNATLNQINADRAVYGLPPVGTLSTVSLRSLMPEAPTPPFGATVAGLPEPDLLEHVALINDDPVTVIYGEDVLAETFNEGIQALSNFIVQLILIDEFLSQQKFLTRRRPNQVILSNAITEQQPVWHGQPGGSRVGYSILAAGFLKNTLSRILGTVLAEAELGQFTGLVPLRTLEEVQTFNFQTLGRASILGARSALALLAGSLGEVNLLSQLNPDGNAVAAALSAGFLTQIRSVVSTDVANEAIETFLTEEGEFENLTPEERLQLINTLAATVNISLLLIGLTEVSIALGASGIAPQLLATAAPGLLEEEPAFSDVIGNRLNIIQFEEQLVNALAQFQGVSRVTQVLREQVAEALGAAFAEAGSSPTAEQFLQALTNQFVRFGRAGTGDIDDIRALAFEGLLFLLDRLPDVRLSGDVLEATLFAGLINEETLKEAGLSAEVAEAVVADLNARQFIDRSILQEGIIKDFTLKGINLRDAIIRDGITRDIIRRDATLRDLRQSIIRSLDRTGTPIDSALSEANQVLDQIRSNYELASINQSILQDEIVNGLIERGIAEDAALERARIAAEQLDRAPADTFRSEGAVRRFLVDAGIPQEVAAAIQIPLIETPDAAAFFPGVAEVLSREEARNLLVNRIDQLLNAEINEKSAVQIRDILARVVVDDNLSIVNLLEKNLKVLEEQKELNIGRELTETFREFMNVNIDLYKFIVEEIMQPGKEFVRVGIMYTKDQPENYVKGVDFQV